MIKQLTILVFFLSSYQTVMIAQTYNQTDDQGRRHGPWQKFYEGSKQLRYQGTFEHGKEVGTFKFYNKKSGSQPSATKTYTSGKETLDVIYFRKNGKKLSQGPMKGRLRQGRWEYYHDDGITLMTVETYKNDTLNGERLVYFPNKQLAQKVRYINGKQEGLEEHFSENGVPLKIYNYKNGRLEGAAKIYDVSGLIIREGNYKDNKKHGLWKYYKAGKLDKEVRFPQNRIGVQG